MRVLVCGSRDWRDGATIRRALLDVMARLPARDRLLVIHGDQRGADRMAASFARACGHHVQAFPADWKTFGRAAGPLRNLAMLDEGPHLVLAFQRNGSPGTQHTIDEARRRGIPVEVHTA